MKINSVKLVTFSPTGNSTKVAKAIAKGIQAPTEHIDITPPIARIRNFEEFQDELTIVASPVYVGRVPYEVAYRIRRLKANNTPTVLVVTYGNRAYEDTLRELGDIVTEVGFKPFAGCAFIGEHSWSIPEIPTARGRPNKDDLLIAEKFGKQIRVKLEGVSDIEKVPLVYIPGKNPYTLSLGGRNFGFDPGELFGPITDEKLCTKCGKCVDVCPTEAVTLKRVVSNPSPRTGLNTMIVSNSEDSCVWCCACVRACPTGARVMRPRMLEITKWLNENLGEWKEPEIYL